MYLNRILYFTILYITTIGGSAAVVDVQATLAEPLRPTRVPFRQQLSQQPSRPLPGIGEVIGATLKIGGITYRAFQGLLDFCSDNYMRK